MSEEKNKTLLRRCVDEVWHKRDPGASEELRLPDFLDHADKEVCGPTEGVRRFHEEAYPEPSPHADVAVEERLPLP
jgi:hypothetical protein